MVKGNEDSGNEIAFDMDGFAYTLHACPSINNLTERHPRVFSLSPPFFPPLQPVLLPEPASGQVRLGMRRKLRNTFLSFELY